MQGSWKSERYPFFPRKVNDLLKDIVSQICTTGSHLVYPSSALTFLGNFVWWWFLIPTLLFGVLGTTLLMMGSICSWWTGTENVGFSLRNSTQSESGKGKDAYAIVSLTLYKAEPVSVPVAKRLQVHSVFSAAMVSRCDAILGLCFILLHNYHVSISGFLLCGLGCLGVVFRFCSIKFFVQINMACDLLLGLLSFVSISLHPTLKKNHHHDHMIYLLINLFSHSFSHSFIYSVMTSSRMMMITHHKLVCTYQKYYITIVLLGIMLLFCSISCPCA